MAKSFLVPINLNQLELQNARIQNLASAPASPVAGQVYFNTTTNKAMVYDGTNWIPWEADTNAVTGVKGNSESTYRTGNVNITAANVGAAPTSHASTATTYGQGTDANYGHVKLSDSTSSTTAAASGGTAATPKAVKDALDAAKAYADALDTGVSDVKVNGTSVVTSGVANVSLVGTQNTVGVVKNGSSVTSTSGLTASPIISGVPYYKDTTYTAATTASAVSTTASGGSASTYSKGDHVHSISLATGDNNGQVKIAGSNVSVKGLGDAAYKAVDTTVTANSSNLITSGAVSTAIGAADAMRFKGTLGTGGTVTTLPTTGVKVGDTYRVITAGTYASIVCEVGDLVIATATTPTWTVAQTNIDGAVTASTTTTNGYLAKFTGDKIVANGPQLGSSTTTYLNNAGNWATPPDTKVTAVGNHYTPSGGTTTSASGATGSAGTTVQVVTGITKDAAGHVTGITSGAATDTRNTAGSTDSSSKLFLIGATSQAANPQTYSHDTAYVGTDGCLYSGGTKVLTAHQTYTQVTGKPTGNQTPSFGGTFTISQISQSTTGQITATDRTITIPNTTATTSAAGLMSASDKSNLTHLVTWAGNIEYEEVVIQAGNTSVDTALNGFDGVLGYTAIQDGEEVAIDMEQNQDGSLKFSVASPAVSAITINVIVY